MSKVYAAPSIAFESYELNASIASNCSLVVEMGPEGPGAIKVCKDYYEKTGEDMPAVISSFSLPHNVSFWSEQTCDCYYTAAGDGCFTS